MHLNPQPRPWYYEQPDPSLFNSWTWTHLAWGMLSARYIQSWLAALLLHTAYEFIEGSLFPSESRDISFRNHVGDTAAFLAGRMVAS